MRPDKRFLIASVIVLSILVVLGLPLSGEPQRGRTGASDPVEPAVELAPDLYFIPGGGANSVVRVTPEGLILIDTKNPDPEIAEALAAEIRRISPEPVRYVLNTHHHPDHVGNNQFFVSAGATVIGLETLRELMTTDARTRDIPGPPTTTFEKDYTLEFGGAVVEAHFYGASHTGSDTVVYMPDKGFIMVSDLINGTAPTPRIIFANGGSAVQVPGLLDRILELDWNISLPGRGEPLGRGDVEAFRNQWDGFMNRVRVAVGQGATRDSLASVLMGQDLEFDFDAGFFTDLYDELQTNPTGEPRLP